MSDAHTEAKMKYDWLREQKYALPWYKFLAKANYSRQIERQILDHISCCGWANPTGFQTCPHCSHSIRNDHGHFCLEKDDYYKPREKQTHENV